MPIQIHRDVEYPFSFPHTPRHEDYVLPVEGPEKTYAALRNCVLPGTVDAAGWMSGDVANSQRQCFASQPISWHELLLETCTSVSAYFIAFIDPRTRRPHAGFLSRGVLQDALLTNTLALFISRSSFGAL